MAAAMAEAMEAARMAETQAALALLPTCVVSHPSVCLSHVNLTLSQKDTAMQAINASGCGLDIPCVCQNDIFLTSLQGAVLLLCNSTEQTSK